MSKHVLTLIFGIIGFMSLGIGSVSALPVEDISTISINASDFMTRFEEKYPSEFSYSKWEDADKKFSMGTKGDAPLVARRAAEKFKNEFYLVENTGYSQKELFETSASLVRNIEGQAGVNDSMKVLASIDPTVPSIEIGVDSSLGAKLSGSIMSRLTSLAGHSSSPATLNARQSMTISSNSVLLEKLSLDINIGGVSLTPQALYGGGRISGNEIGYCTTGFSATKPGYSQGFITAGHCVNKGDSLFYGALNSSIGLSKITWTENSVADAGFLSASGYVTAPQFWSLGNGGLTNVTWKFTPSIGQSLAMKGESSGRQYDTVQGYICSGTPGCGIMYTSHHYTQGGDSGGPWFSNGGAAGIHGGEYHKEDNTYHSYFTTISKAESVTGAKIKMG